VIAMQIPDRLQDDSFKFVKVKRNAKRPIESNWQASNNYQFDSRKLEDHLSNGGNYGVATGYGDHTDGMSVILEKSEG